MLITNVKRAVLNQFNLSNNIVPQVNVDDVNFLVPEIWLQGECNTRVAVQAATSSVNFAGGVTLNYNRRRADLDLRGVKIPGRATDYTRTYQIYAVLREKLGVPVVDTEYLDQPFNGTVFNLVITPVSLAYLPGFNITLPFAEV